MEPLRNGEGWLADWTPPNALPLPGARSAGLGFSLSHSIVFHEVVLWCSTGRPEEVSLVPKKLYTGTKEALYWY